MCQEKYGGEKLVWTRGCGVRYRRRVVCGMWRVECGVWYGVGGAEWLVRGMWCVVCGVWRVLLHM